VYSRSAFRCSSIVLILLACLTWSGKLSPAQGTTQKAASATDAAGLAAWQQVYSVLTYPRCINCHTATNYPEQGDDRHRHLFNVVRGPGGKACRA
jgi:mono/diheme cytochrome c family protein